MNQWRVRLIANGIVIVFLLCIIIIRLMTFSTSSVYYWLWGLPSLIICFLQIYFLMLNLKDEPDAVDTSLTSFVVSVFAALGLGFVALVVDQPLINFTYRETLRQIGGIVALMPYPFLIWALLCLKKCMTVVPEAHEVIAHGIYKYSRHPLYVCYMVWILSNIMLFPSWPVIIVSGLAFIALLIRLKREEQLLLASLPDYREYYLKTGLIGRRINLRNNRTL